MACTSILIVTIRYTLGAVNSSVTSIAVALISIYTVTCQWSLAQVGLSPGIGGRISSFLHGITLR